jgi:hypothetical protein
MLAWLVCETSIVAFGGFLDRLLGRLQCARLRTRQEESETTQAKPVKHLRLLRSGRAGHGAFLSFVFSAEFFEALAFGLRQQKDSDPDTEHAYGSGE